MVGKKIMRLNISNCACACASLPLYSVALRIFLFILLLVLLPPSSPPPPLLLPSFYLYTFRMNAFSTLCTFRIVLHVVLLICFAFVYYLFMVHFSLVSSAVLTIFVFRCIDANSRPSVIEKIFLVVGMLSFFAMGMYHFPYFPFIQGVCVCSSLFFATSFNKQWHLMSNAMAQQSIIFFFRKRKKNRCTSVLNDLNFLILYLAKQNSIYRN